MVGVFDGVAKEILEDERGEFAVAGDGAVGRDFGEEFETLGFGFGAKAGEEGFDELAHVEGFALGGDHGVAESFGGEEAVHAVHGFEDGAADGVEVVDVVARRGFSAEALAVDFENEEGVVEMVAEIVGEEGKVLGFGLVGGAELFALELGEVVDAFLERGIDAEIEGDEFGGGERARDIGGDFLDDDAAEEAVLGEEFAEGVLMDEAFVGVGAGGLFEGEGFHGAGGAEGVAEAIEEEREVIAQLGEGHGFGVGERFADGGFPAFEDGFLAVE